jgi:hypothetical protein
MKAIVIRRFGGPEVLELADLPLPAPGSRQLLGAGWGAAGTVDGPGSAVRSTSDPSHPRNRLVEFAVYRSCPARNHAT